MSDHASGQTVVAGTPSLRLPSFLLAEGRSWPVKRGDLLGHQPKMDSMGRGVTDRVADARFRVGQRFEARTEADSLPVNAAR